MGGPRRRLGLLAAVALTITLAGCGSDTVRLALLPSVGHRSEYRIAVRAESVTTLTGSEPRRTVEETVLVAAHRVLEAGPDGSRVEVRLSEEGAPVSTFVVRFDRAAQPVEVQRIEGVPAGALGDLGLSEIFPAAAGAPPDRPLEPGDRWAIDEPAPGGASATARLLGQGRLVALAAADGRRLARVESDYRLPVRRSAEETGGRLLLDGTVTTRARVAYDLDDDVVQSVQARTRGRYEVTLLPPAGVAGAPVPGTLVVDVDSTTRRVG